jgi:predicted GIY-YIG superfamily endonuclease
MQWYCYILRTINPFYPNNTYNGSTNNLSRRLKQHNGLKAGGAKATCNKGPWEFYAVLTGFKNQNEALSCEWKIKHPTGKKLRPKKYCGIEGRIKSLNLILSLDKWTTKSDGLENGNEYILYLSNDIYNIIDKNNIKPNIIIKSIDELVID